MHLGLGVPRVVLLLSGLTAGLGLLVYAASFLSLRQSLLLWGFLSIGGMLVAAWLMSIRMPHDLPLRTAGRGSAPSSLPKKKRA